MEAERRQDYPDILDKLNKLETVCAILQTLQNKDLDIAEEWRKKFCDKIEKIQDNLSNLPCDLRKGWYDSMSKQIRFMWLVLTGYIAILLTVLSIQYSTANEIRKDISLIKQHSYGYQEFIDGKKNKQMP